MSDHLKDFALSLLEEMKAVDIVILNVQKLTTICNYMIIASGTSTRHIKAMSEKLVTEIKHNLKINPIGVEGQQHADWVLADYDDVIIHLMKPETRNFYQLEKLWNIKPVQAFHQKSLF